MSARSIASRELKQLALDQAKARDRLKLAANEVDPDPSQVLLDIGSLTFSTADAAIAIQAARAVAKATHTRVSAANGTHNLPDAEEWGQVASHFNLDSDTNYSSAQRLQYARAYRGLRRTLPASLPVKHWILD